MTSRRSHLIRPLCALWLCLGAILGAWAQLPDGSVAPDFSVVDLEGDTWALSSLLDSGNTVVLNFGATWCTSCWAAEHAGALNSLHNAFGPQGSGDVTVLFLEMDDAFTSADDLSGSGSNSVGNWLEMLDYPVVDSAGAIHALYGGSDNPFVCLVCPDGLVTNLNELDFGLVQQAALSACGNDVDGPAAWIERDGLQSTCGEEAAVGMLLTNLGNDTLVSATLDFWDGIDTTEVLWSGSLAVDSTVFINMGNVDVLATWTATLTSLNGAARSYVRQGTLAGSTPTTSRIEVMLTTDHWPEETGWHLVDEQGMVLEQVDIGSLEGLQETTLTWEVELPALGCYELTLLDAAGDGLEADVFGDYPNGSLVINNMDAGEVTTSAFELDGGAEGAFFENIVGIRAEEVSGITTKGKAPAIALYPNPAQHAITLTCATSNAELPDIAVFDVAGRRMEIPMRPQRFFETLAVELDIQSLSRGMYFVRLGSEHTSGGLSFHKR